MPDDRSHDRSHDRSDDRSDDPAVRADAWARSPGPVHRAEVALDRPSRPPATMPPDQRVRLRTAALLAAERYPGPVGELLARELLVWEDFGHRFGAHSLVSRLVAHILDPGFAPAVDPAGDGTAA